jgi:hypothetical protein
VREQHSQEALRHAKRDTAAKHAGDRQNAVRKEFEPEKTGFVADTAAGQCHADTVASAVGAERLPTLAALVPVGLDTTVVTARAHLHVGSIRKPRVLRFLRLVGSPISAVFDLISPETLQDVLAECAAFFVIPPDIGRHPCCDRLETGRTGTGVFIQNEPQVVAVAVTAIAPVHAAVHAALNTVALRAIFSRHIRAPLNRHIRASFFLAQRFAATTEWAPTTSLKRDDVTVTTAQGVLCYKLSQDRRSAINAGVSV